MTNLPIRGETDSLDNLAVTREEFRVGIGQLLEYLAQALGGVDTVYADQDVEPTAVILQGTPTLDIDAVPPDADNSLRIPSTAWVREALAELAGDFVEGSGGSLTGDLSLPSLNGGPLAGFRSILLNGDFRVDQRGAGGAFGLTAGGVYAYVVDRWYAYCSGANVTGQRVTVAGTQADPFRLQLTGAASVTGIGVAQRIEAVNSRHLAGRSAALSVNLSNSLLTTVGWEVFYADSNDSFGSRASPARTSIASGTFSVTGTYNRYSATFDIPAAATTGLEVVLTVNAQTSGTWMIGQVQLENGSRATPFERRPYQLEEQLCQRYFLRGRSSATLNVRDVTANVSFATFFPQQMRVTPTIAGYTPSFTTVYGWTGFQNVLGFSWAGDVPFTADAEL
jgi:hypothetical protein